MNDPNQANQYPNVPQQPSVPQNNKNMMFCKSCGTQIAKSAKNCPSCGAKNKKPIYKRVWFWLIIVFCVIGTSSFMGDSNNTSSIAEPTTSVTLTTSTTWSATSITDSSTNTDATTNINDIPRDAFEKLCDFLPYNKILRTPDVYENTFCKISGTVDQVIEGWFDCYTIYVIDADNNKWSCSYTYKEGESRLLEGDEVIIYGICNGTSHSTTLLGKQITLPDVDVKYITLK